jgi:hypothetical protein
MEAFSMRSNVTFVFVVILVLLSNSCQSDSQYQSVESNSRGVDVSILYEQNIHQQLTVTAVPYIHPRFTDSVLNENWLTKLELDYGDDSGWQDLTQAYLAGHALNAVTEQNSFKHTYTQSGTYTIHIRATFWDGDVVADRLNGTEATTYATVPPPGS